ncbi:MAG: PEP/pyruvate-binding domain-containing protein [Thermodesulfovibrionales bacterium]
MKKLSRSIASLLRGRAPFVRRKAAAPVPFAVLFDRFRELLGKHNRAMECIADMGEKLGGDYLFDITYLRDAYAELSGNMTAALSGFDGITQGRYARLREVFQSIDSEIRRHLYHTASSTGHPVLFYGNIRGDALHEVGGKNAFLAEVKKGTELRVPDGFAFTVHAYDAFVRHNGLAGRIARLEEDAHREETLQEIRETIRGGELPPGVGAALNTALDRLGNTCRETFFLAVRSSAEEEDGELSFAGQFETVLNVPPESGAVQEAYKRVVAGMFSPKALGYLRQTGGAAGKMRMAVGCLRMVEAVSSGVAYSTGPRGEERVLITAGWGLGKSVVEGQIDADFYAASKEDGHAVLERRVGRKETRVTGCAGGGVCTEAVPAGLAAQEALTREQVHELVEAALLLERHFRGPQDIEWAFGKDGLLYILQARPLRIVRADPSAVPSAGEYPGGQADSQISPPAIPGARPLDIPRTKEAARLRGVSVQRGAGAGRVFVLRQIDDLDTLPRGAVLVARNDSSHFIRAMPYVSAIITDVGSTTSHMASLCREFRVPALVNTGTATRTLAHGREVTVQVDDGGTALVYEGRVREVLGHAAAALPRMDDLHEFRRKRYVVRYISPLNLIDPLQDDFTPEGCRTLHDILRFIHEKSVVHLVESARSSRNERAAVKLELSVPAGIVAIDIGGGLSPDVRKGKASFGQVTSHPLRAFLQGVLHPGAWRADAVSLKAGDFFSSMMRMPDIVSDPAYCAGYNLAVISRDYMNVSLHLGYHYTTIDCYCGANTRNNHLYFRFSGGATDRVKRERRVRLIASVLKEYGFSLVMKEDLLIARLSNAGQNEMEQTLTALGKLTAYTRQLDAVLHDDGAVERHAEAFLRGEEGSARS